MFDYTYETRSQWLSEWNGNWKWNSIIMKSWTNLRVEIVYAEEYGERNQYHDIISYRGNRSCVSINVYKTGSFNVNEQLAFNVSNRFSFECINSCKLVPNIFQRVHSWEQSSIVSLQQRHACFLRTLFNVFCGMYQCYSRGTFTNLLVIDHTFLIV